MANTGSNNVSVLLGNGNGSFQGGARNFGVGYGPAFLAVGHFNGDRVQDLAVVNRSTTSVLINNMDL